MRCRCPIKNELLPPALDELPQIRPVGADVHLYDPVLAALFDPVQVVLSGLGTGAAREHRRGWNAEHRNRSTRAGKLAETEAMLMTVQDQLCTVPCDHVSEVPGVCEALMFGRIVGHRRMMQEDNSEQLRARRDHQA